MNFAQLCINGMKTSITKRNIRQVYGTKNIVTGHLVHNWLLLAAYHKALEEMN